MKKYLTKIASIFSILLFTLVVVAGCSCGQKQLERIELKEGSIEFIYEKDVPADFSDIVVYAHYNDGTKVTLGEDDLEISPFSTSVEGTHEVTIKYEGKELKVQLTVTNDPDAFYRITGFEQSLSYDKYLLNSKFEGEDEKSKKIEFFDKEKIYVVGDDNDFTYRPNISAFNDENRLLDDDEITSFRTIAKLYLKDGNDYVLLTGEDLTAKLENISDESDLATGEINETDFKYNFTQAAVGSEFKLEVRPFYMPEGEDPADMTRSITFKVVDGYNVTDAVELGLMVNINARNTDYLGAWNALFALKPHITKPNNLKGLILHKDIVITKDDIPSAYFETDNPEYLVDYADIYTVGIRPNDSFDIYGNYFKIDASQIPSIDLANADGGTSHASLFKTRLIDTTGTCNDENFEGCTSGNNAKFKMQDVLLIGNTNRENNGKGFGGIMMGKFQNVDNTIENTIIQTFYINTYADQEETGTGSKLTLNLVKSYDAYQNLLMGWGAETVDIKESELMSAGGPAMLFMHPYADEYTTSHFTNVTVDKKSKIESWVMGSEAWFTTTGSSQTAAMISLFNTLFVKQGNSTFVNSEGKMNIVSVFMGAGGFKDVLGARGIQGKLTINDKVVINKNLEEGNETLYGMINSEQLIGAPLAISNAGDLSSMGLIYATIKGDTVTPVGILNPQTQDTISADSALFKGDYLGLYYNGMGIGLGYTTPPVAE